MDNYAMIKASLKERRKAMNSYNAYNKKFANGSGSYSAEAISDRAVPVIINALLVSGILFSSLILPLYLKNMQTTYAISWISCIISATTVFISTKKRFWAIWIIFFMALIIGMLGSPIIPAMLFGAITAVGSGTSLICSAPKKLAFLPPLLPIGAYGIALALTRDPAVSIGALILLLPMIAMGYTSRADTSRTVSVGICAIVESALLIGGVAIWVYVAYGELTLSSLSAASEYFKGGFVYYSELGMQTLYQAEITPIIKKELYASANTLVNVSIGLAGACFIVTSFLSHGIHLGISSTYGNKNEELKNSKITVSVEAALIFVTAYILSFSTNASNMMSLPATAALNICIILIPCLAYLGFDTLSLLPKKLGLLGLILWGGVIMMIVASSSSFLFVFALIGSAYVIIRNVDAWAKDFYSKGDKK